MKRLLALLITVSMHSYATDLVPISMKNNSDGTFKLKKCTHNDCEEPTYTMKPDTLGSFDLNKDESTWFLINLPNNDILNLKVAFPDGIIRATAKEQSVIFEYTEDYKMNAEATIVYTDIELMKFIN